MMYGGSRSKPQFQGMGSASRAGNIFQADEWATSLGRATERYSLSSRDRGFNNLNRRGGTKWSGHIEGYSQNNRESGKWSAQMGGFSDDGGLSNSQGGSGGNWQSGTRNDWQSGGGNDWQSGAGNNWQSGPQSSRQSGTGGMGGNWLRGSTNTMQDGMGGFTRNQGNSGRSDGGLALNQFSNGSHFSGRDRGGQSGQMQMKSNYNQGDYSAAFGCNRSDQVRQSENAQRINSSNRQINTSSKSSKKIDGASSETQMLSNAGNKNVSEKKKESVTKEEAKWALDILKQVLTKDPTQLFEDEALGDGEGFLPQPDRQGRQDMSMMQDFQRLSQRMRDFQSPSQDDIPNFNFSDQDMPNFPPSRMGMQNFQPYGPGMADFQPYEPGMPDFEPYEPGMQGMQNFHPSSRGMQNFQPYDQGIWDQEVDLVSAFRRDASIDVDNFRSGKRKRPVASRLGPAMSPLAPYRIGAGPISSIKSRLGPKISLSQRANIKKRLGILRDIPPADINVKSLRCKMCDMSSFRDVQSYFDHWISPEHQDMTKLLKTKIIATKTYLLRQAKLSFSQQTTYWETYRGVMCDLCKVPLNLGKLDHMQVKECKLLHDYWDPPFNCCERTFDSRVSFEIHRSSDADHLVREHTFLGRKRKEDIEKLNLLKAAYKEGRKQKKMKISNDSLEHAARTYELFGTEPVPDEVTALLRTFSTNVTKEYPAKMVNRHYDPAVMQWWKKVVIDTGFRCSLCRYVCGNSKETILEHCSSKRHYDNCALDKAGKKVPKNRGKKRMKKVQDGENEETANVDENPEKETIEGEEGNESAQVDEVADDDDAHAMPADDAKDDVNMQNEGTDKDINEEEDGRHEMDEEEGMDGVVEGQEEMAQNDNRDLHEEEEEELNEEEEEYEDANDEEDEEMDEEDQEEEEG